MHDAVRRTVRTANLGFPPIGADRELKFATESYWRGETDAEGLRRVAAGLRERHWRLQAATGLAYVPSNDFSLYDRMLDASVALGALAPRFAAIEDPLEALFAAARGRAGAPPLEMTKWFSTNYHYVVPELSARTRFRADARVAVDAFAQARAVGVETRPVLIGPLTFLRLSRYEGADPLDLVEGLGAAYAELLARLAEAGATSVQLDEPALCGDLDAPARAALGRLYAALREGAPRLELAVTTAFGALEENLAAAVALPIEQLHLDCVHDPEAWRAVADAAPERLTLSLGVIDGRNVWRADLRAATATLRAATARLGVDRVVAAPSCSLLHVPIDAAREGARDPELARWLAFGVQKLEELRLLAAGLPEGAPTRELDAAQALREERLASPRVVREDVRARAASLAAGADRRAPYPERVAAQRDLALPPLPTTTIGSLPQTPELRRLRAERRAGRLDADAYARALREETAEVVRWQEAIGLDVLVHGEFERNDMVEYFGERLEGCGTTAHGWVQSYGTRYVKPPFVYGDVRRPGPMTVEASAYARSLTERPVKGMLTGPVTILQWSFVRDDQPREATALQIALALRDEVADLERAGLRIVQVDEPGLREGAPLRAAERPAYLAWAARAFRVAVGGAAPATQVHTHMCYADFSAIMPTIVALDADALSLEATRSGMEVLADLAAAAYPYGVGPGVYDIHSPVVPTREELRARIDAILAALPAERVWINPDCGLKTRGWEETRASLVAMVAAAGEARSRLLQPA